MITVPVLDEFLWLSIEFSRVILLIIQGRLSKGTFPRMKNVVSFLWLISVCMCLFVWMWGGKGSVSLFFNKGLSLPAHLAVIRKQHDQPFDLTVWLRRRTFKVVFEMHCCGWNTCTLCVRVAHPPLCQLESAQVPLFCFFPSILPCENVFSIRWLLSLKQFFKFKTFFLKVTVASSILQSFVGSILLH